MNYIFLINKSVAKADPGKMKTYCLRSVGDFPHRGAQAFEKIIIGA